MADANSDESLSEALAMTNEEAAAWLATFDECPLTEDEIAEYEQRLKMAKASSTRVSASKLDTSD